MLKCGFQNIRENFMDKDKNGAEIAECKQRISKCNAQIADNRITIESLEEKIERLKSARDAVSAKKEEIGTTISNMAGTIESMDYFIWCGSNRESFDGEVIKALEDCDAFNQDVDSLQDALNDEITQLENKRYEHEGIIGQLKMVLNDLDNWLTKLLN